MTRLGVVMSEAIVHHYGRGELLGRLARGGSAASLCSGFEITRPVSASNRTSLRPGPSVPTLSAIGEMGEEIGAAGFRREDFAHFADRLAEETAIARGLFANNGFSRSGHMLGFEIECWILDYNYFPSSITQRLLETLAHPLVVPELSRFNVELNCEPLLITGNVLDRAAMALSRLWAECNAVAHTLDANMVMIGTLPTIRDEDLTLANMSPLNRFFALNREVLRQCHGRALRVDILGREHLISEHRDVMLEAATTSFQIHLKAPARLAHLYYNASIAISAPVLAACGNAPFLFGKCSLRGGFRAPVSGRHFSISISVGAETGSIADRDRFAERPWGIGRR